MITCGFRSADRAPLRARTKADGRPTQRQLSAPDGFRCTVPPDLSATKSRGTCSVPARPVKSNRRKFPVGAIVTPLLLGVLLAVVTRRPEIALFAIFSPVMIFWNIIGDRRTQRDDLAKRGADHVVSVERVIADISGFADDWARWFRHTHPDPFTAAGLVERLSTRIWERRPGDVDYLRLRVGTGTVAAPITIVAESVGTTTEDLTRAEAAATASTLPVVVGLADHGVVSVVGTPALGNAVLRWTAAQLTILHSPRDVALAAVVVDSELADMLRWLPHTDHGLVDSAPVVGPGRAAATCSQTWRLWSKRVGGRPWPVVAQPATALTWLSWSRLAVNWTLPCWRQSPNWGPQFGSTPFGSEPTPGKFRAPAAAPSPSMAMRRGRQPSPVTPLAR